MSLDAHDIEARLLAMEAQQRQANARIRSTSNKVLILGFAVLGCVIAHWAGVTFRPWFFFALSIALPFAMGWDDSAIYDQETR